MVKDAADLGRELGVGAEKHLEHVTAADYADEPAFGVDHRQSLEAARVHLTSRERNGRVREDADDLPAHRGSDVEGRRARAIETVAARLEHIRVGFALLRLVEEICL